MSEEEILKMMPPEKDESKSRNPVDVTFEVAYNHARKEIARALSGKIAKPRKVDRERILSIVMLNHNKGVTDGDVADAIMREVGG